MNKVLPNQANWQVPTPQVHLRRQDDFAERLNTRSREEESSRPKADRCATANDSRVSGSSSTDARPVKDAGSFPIKKSVLDGWEKSAMPAAVNVSALKPNSAGVEACFGPAPGAVLVYKGASTSSIGLLSEMLTWSRVYPEHLVASGYLSVVDTAARDGSAPPDEAALAVSSIDIRESDLDATAAEKHLHPTKAATAALSVAPREPIANTRLTTVSGLDLEVVSLAREPDATMLADRFWAERLMRMSCDSDGRSTVWLRDYGLKESHLEHVAAKLRERGRQEGVLIGRVVINGREIWRAAASEGER